MTKLPSISGRECVRALGKVGFILRRQEGSHIILRRSEPFAQVVVPDHRTPEELLDLIEAKGREVAEALAALRALSRPGGGG